MNLPATYGLGMATGAALTVLGKAIVDFTFRDVLHRRDASRTSLLQRETEARANERQDEPTRIRIAAGLASVCHFLSRTFIDLGPSEPTWVHVMAEGLMLPPAEWRRRHDALEQLLKSDAAARVLGEHYEEAMLALHFAESSIRVHEKRIREFEATSGKSEVSVERTLIEFTLARHAASAVILQFVGVMVALRMEDAETWKATAYEQLVRATEDLNTI